jgi:hypothetical protein
MHFIRPNKKALLRNQRVVHRNKKRLKFYLNKNRKQVLEQELEQKQEQKFRENERLNFNPKPKPKHYDCYDDDCTD